MAADYVKWCFPKAVKYMAGMTLAYQYLVSVYLTVLSG